MVCYGCLSTTGKNGTLLIRDATIWSVPASFLQPPIGTYEMTRQNIAHLVDRSGLWRCNGSCGTGIDISLFEAKTSTSSSGTTTGVKGNLAKFTDWSGLGDEVADAVTKGMG
jgi:hypothetical protein